MGLRSRKGNRINKSSIARTLQNTTYTGEFIWKGITYQGKYEPIISRALFDSVQERRNAVSHSNPKRQHHAFRGLVRCGTCGCMVSGTTKREKYTYYGCSHHHKHCTEKAVTGGALSEMLGNPLKSLRLSQERVEWIVDKIKAEDAKTAQTQTNELRKLRKTESEFAAKLDLIYEDKLSGTINRDFWQRKHEEYNSRLNWVRGEIRDLEQDSGDKLASVERILELSQKAYSLYLTRNQDEQRELLDIVLWNSKLKGQKLTSEFRHPYRLIADGAIEDQAREQAGEPILAHSENWVPEWYGNKEKHNIERIAC